MLELLLLVILGILIARTIWRIFGICQTLFAYLHSFISISLFSSSRNLADSEQLCQSKQVHGYNKKSESKNTERSSAIIKENTTVQQKVRQPNTHSKQQMEQLQKYQQSKFQKIHSQIREQREEMFPTRLQRLQVDIDERSTKNQEYQMTINGLKEQIAIYQRQKQLYIQRIQQIIQHVVNETELEEQQSRNSTQDDQLGAINNLKHQLIAAHHKIYEQKELLTKKFETEKEQLIRYYQQKNHALQEDLINKITLYESTINQVSQRIQEMERNGSNSHNVTQEKVEEQEQLVEKQRYQQLKRQLDQTKQKLTAQSQRVQIQAQNSKKELQTCKEQLRLANNQLLRQQSNYSAQVSLLQTSNKKITQDLLAARLELTELLQGEKEIIQESQDQRKKYILLQQRFDVEKKRREQIQKKFQQTQQQLKFCQQQLKNLRDSQSLLKNKPLKESQSSKKLIRSPRGEQLSNQSQLARKVENERFKRKGDEKQDNTLRNKNQQNSSSKQRQFSPCFPGEITSETKRTSPSPASQNKRITNTSPYSRITSTKSPTHVTTSSILSHQDKRSNTNGQKTVACSTIIEGGILAEAYLGETEILNTAQRNFIIHQVSAVKKISVKKTRIMYSSRQKVNKSIHEFILGAPNIIIVAQLQNHKIVGAFTQNAFSRENKFTKSSVVSKAMIFDVNKQVFITNEGKGQIIRCEENALIWGNNEFVVHCQEPLKISVNLNCEGGVYQSNYSSEQFLGSPLKAINVAKLEVHRVFLG